MKILLISNMYPSNKYPSYGVFVKNTEDILVNNSYRVERVALRKQDNKILKVMDYIFFYMKIVFKGIFDESDVLYVHYASHCAIPVIIVKKLRVNKKIYTNLHGSDVVPESKNKEKLQKYVKTLLLMSDKIIVPSNYFKKLVGDKYGLSKNKIYVFPSGGVNSDKFYPIEKRYISLNEMKLDPSYQYLGYVGRIDYKKGWDVFLKAIKLLKENGKMENRKALVIGNGKEIDGFYNYIKTNNLKDDVICFDLLTQDKLLYAYNCMDVLCFPTMREGESLGLVGLEAMSCGVPVIASNFAGPTDYIEHNVNGYLFEVGNFKELYSRINDYTELSYNKKQLMKKKSLEKVNCYYSKNIKNDIIKIIEYDPKE